MFGEWLSLVEHLVRDQGVGGSNPLSPTNQISNLRSIPEARLMHRFGAGTPLGAPLRLSSGSGWNSIRRRPFSICCWLLSSIAFEFMTMFLLRTLHSHARPTRFCCNLPGSSEFRYAHVVARHLRAGSATTHQAGMHRPEAAEIDTLRNIMCFRDLLQMPTRGTLANARRCFRGDRARSLVREGDYTLM
jgi:hypothetical protein